MSDSLASLFLTNYDKHRDEIAFRERKGYRTVSFTYAEILNSARSFSSQFKKREIKKGDRILVWGQNSAEWVAVFLASVLAGVVVVPMDDAASTDFALRVHRQSAAKLLVTTPPHLRELAASGFSSATVDLQQLEKTHGSNLQTPDVEVRGDDVLQIVFTSGTTSEPRGVVITHKNVMANIAPLEQQIRGYLKYERFVHPLRFLNLLPLSHVFGQFLGMYLPPLLGATVIFQDELKPSEIIHTARRERVSVLVSVPRVLQSLKQKVERDMQDRGETAEFRAKYKSSEGQHFLHRWWIFRKIHRQFGWKFWAMISGGAALDRETEEFWGRVGFAVIQGYGLTETTSLISVNHPFRLGKGSIGKVLPGREVTLADDGEILVRGGGVASGYLDQSGERGVADDEGWYRTGDIGAMDEAGNLYFKGRKKEVIVTPAGMKVYPDDLEAALRRQPEVKDCVVVGIERGGNAEPCAVVILRDGDVNDVIDRTNRELADYQQMRMWMHWSEEDFPRTNTQKPRRNLIKQAAEAQILRIPTNNTEASPLATLIAQLSGRPETALRENATLDSDLGLSSLDRVELMSALEDRYQVDLSETRFSAVKTIADVERMLRGEASATLPYHYPSWVVRWPVTWARFLAHYLLMRPAIVLLGWPRMVGRENLKGVRGPLLVVANHLGDVDPGFILTALPARFRHRLAIGAGGEALEALRVPASERGWFGRVYDQMQWALGVSLLNLFPLPREAGFRRSFAYAGEVVDRGYSVLVFPEGRHTTTGEMNPFRSGIGLLAQNLGIPVLPMRIDGLYEVKRAGRSFAKPYEITVRIGKPMKFQPDVKPEEIAALVQNAVAAL